MSAQGGYQGRIHLHQKQLMRDYYDGLTRIAETGDGKAACLMIAGSPLELLRAFDIVPMIPEINAVQIAVKKQALPYIQKAEEMGYSLDNCGYVKADVGLIFSGNVTPFGKIPVPNLILCNYVGCNVFLHWFEHVAEYTGAPIYQLDVPFLRAANETTFKKDLEYVVKQLEELIELLERVSGRAFDEDKLRESLAFSQETVEYWTRIKEITKRRPTPIDAFFDFVSLMGPLHCLRGTEECRDFFRSAWEEIEEKAAYGEGILPEERFRVVFEGPPPWPYLRTFRDMFTKWGAVGVASTYSTIGGLWEFGFRYDLSRPLETIAEHMLLHNFNNRDLCLRAEQILRYAVDWNADAVVIHSVKSCRLFSAGQGDLREYFGHDIGIPTLLIESDVEDPRYFSEAQMRNRVDAFFESLEHKKLLSTA